MPVKIWDILQLELRAFGDRQSLSRFAMNKLRTKLDGPEVKVRINSAADPVARFESDDVQTCIAQFTSGRKPGSTCSNNDDVTIHASTD
jgi:hypothetical protein